MKTAGLRSPLIPIAAVVLWVMTDQLDGDFICRPPQQQEASQPDDLVLLVQQLGGDTYRQRQAAMSGLIEAGLQAIGPLTSALKPGDPETRIRVIAVLARLAVSMDDETRAAAQAVIESLTQSDDADIARLAQRTWQDLGRQLQQSAGDQLQSHGASLTGQTVYGNFANQSSMELMIGPNWKGNRNDLESIRWLVDLTSITLIGPDIDDELIRLIRDLPQLHNVVIKRAAITNASMESFARLRSLRRLQIVYCQIDDDCYESLKQFKQQPNGSSVPEIWLYGTRFTREAADRLKQETGLEIDLRKGAFLGIYFNQSDGPCEISRVVANSAAEQGGFLAGDIVKRFAGRDIVSGEDFRGAVSEYSPGDKISVTVQRGEDTLELDIVLGKFPDIEQ